MDTGWQNRVRPWQVVTSAAIVVLLVISVLNSRRPDVEEAVGRAIPLLVCFLIVGLVDQRRKGRSVPRSIGRAVLTAAALAVFLAAMYGLEMLFGRPRDVDPFSESIGPPASYVAVVIVICLAWAAVAKQLDLGPWARKGDL